MRRPMTILLLAAGLAVSVTPTHAQTADAQHQSRKSVKGRKAVAPPVASPSRGINAPSTDFSKIERSGEEMGGPDQPSLRPAMGAGGMGLGGSF